MTLLPKHEDSFEPPRERDAFDFVLGFLAGAIIVGLPVGYFLRLPWRIVIVIVAAAGVLGGLYGDRFLLFVAKARAGSGWPRW